MFQVIYSKVKDEKKADLRHSFRLLIEDESVIVRKTAATELVELIPLLDRDSLKNEFVPVFDNISKDTAVSV